MERYSELVDFVLQKVVGAKEDVELYGCYFCKSGNHRSVLWALVEGWVMQYLGVKAKERPLCWWAQDRVTCQRPGRRNCRLCTPDAPELDPFRKIVITEFLEYVATC